MLFFLAASAQWIDFSRAFLSSSIPVLSTPDNRKPMSAMILSFSVYSNFRMANKSWLLLVMQSSTLCTGGSIMKRPILGSRWSNSNVPSLRGCLKTQSQPSETCEHETNHGQIDHGLAGLGLSFVVAVEPAVAPEPTEGSFHYPASRQHLERMEFVALHDFQGAAPQVHGPLDQRARVAAIGPDMSDAAAHRLALTEEAGQQLSSAIAVLEIGGQHRHQQQQANRVHQDVTLASVDLLARVVASLVARLRASDALAVDDPRTGLAISSSRHAHLFAQMSVNSHPKPIALPQSEIVIDRSPPGKVLRQIAPLAAGLCEIEDRIDQLPKGMLARPSRLGGLGKAVIDQLPFGISKVGSITHPQGNRGMYIQCTYNSY